MKNPSAKKSNFHNNNNDKKIMYLNNDFLKNQLSKIIFRKNTSKKEIKKHKKNPKSVNSFNFVQLPTRNITNSNNDSKYTSIKSNNLDTLEKTHNNDSGKINSKKGEKIMTQKFNKPNIYLFDAGNSKANDRKLSMMNRAITQPHEKREIMGYKSC